MKLTPLALLLVCLAASPRVTADSYTVNLVGYGNGRLLANHLDAVGAAFTNTIGQILNYDENGPGTGRSTFRGCDFFSPRSSAGERKHLIFALGQMGHYEPYDTFFGIQGWDSTHFDEAGGGLNNSIMVLVPGDGFLMIPGANRSSYKFQGVARIPSGKRVNIPAGGACLLAAETVTNGTYEIVVGDIPSEGIEVWRLNTNGWALHFGPPDYTIYTYRNGAWTPETPVLDIGEAAWFRAPPPALNLSMTNGTAVVSWTTNSIPFTLESLTLFGVSNSWTVVTNLVVTNGALQTVTIPLTTGAGRFYRLRR